MLYIVLSSLLIHLLFTIYYAILTGFLNLKPLCVYLFFVCNLFISFHALLLLAKLIRISHLNLQVQKKPSEQLLKSGHILMAFLVTFLYMSGCWIVYLWLQFGKDLHLVDIYLYHIYTVKFSILLKRLRSKIFSSFTMQVILFLTNWLGLFLYLVVLATDSRIWYRDGNY